MPAFDFAAPYLGSFVLWASKLFVKGLVETKCTNMNLGPPPPGGDQNKGPTLLAVSWTFTSIAIAVVGLKLYTRFRILREPALDDFFTVLSVVRV